MESSNCSDCAPVHVQSMLQVLHVHGCRLWHAHTILQKCHTRKKETRCYQFLVLVNQSHKLVIYQICKLVQKKLWIGNHFLAFLPFPGYKIQNLDSISIYETQLTEAFWTTYQILKKISLHFAFSHQNTCVHMRVMQRRFFADFFFFAWWCLTILPVPFLFFC